MAEVSDEWKEYFLKISKNPLDNLSQYIAPHLVGREWYWIRRAILMILATQNDIHTRNRIHMLLIGPAGMGKTEICLWVREYLQGIMINAELTSKVGLVGDARGNKITPGLLADADENLILIDELDKANTRDQNGLLQALEEGYFSIIKGKHRGRFKAEVRVIATANIMDKIQKPLLDRFDFIFYVGMSTREERANSVSKLVDKFVSGQEKQQANIITKYINWINEYDIGMPSSDEIERINDIIREYILRTKTDIRYVSYRSLELSILRIAYAFARLERKTCNSSHVETAIWLKDQILRNVAGVYNSN